MMKKFLQKRLNNEKGLTLVELLAVIVILGIIAAIAVPSIGGIIEKSRVNAAVADAQNAIAAANLYFVEDQEKETATLADLTSNDFLQDAGTLQDGIIVTKDKEGNFIGGTALIKGGKVVTFTKATNKMLSEKKGYEVSGE